VIECESLQLPLLGDDSIAAMHCIGLARTPREACGILLAYPHASYGRIIELPNHKTGEGEYELHTADITHKLTPIELERLSPIAIWHTHPSGFVGPSVDDLRNKVAGIPYLVISMAPQGPIATWF